MEECYTLMKKNLLQIDNEQNTTMLYPNFLTRSPNFISLTNFSCLLLLSVYLNLRVDNTSQPAITCSKLTIETLEQKL